jgi:hypothetical protein
MRHPVAARDRVFPRKTRRRAGFHPVRGLRPSGPRERAAAHNPKCMAMRNRTCLAVPLTALLSVLSSCGDPSGPGTRTGVPPGELVFIRQAANAPALEATQVSFWAVAGEHTEVELEYVDGRECLEFDVPGDALLARPDGTRFQRGDSVLITIRVVDPTLYDFEFQPAGLRFDPEHPARLEVSYRYADPDFNQDGVVDERDRSLDFGFWRREAGASGWDEIFTVRDASIEELRAEVRGFTRYAVAAD